jgi:hypothetical protein
MTKVVMSDEDKTDAKKELAAKNMRIAIIVGLAALGFYAAIVLTYMK